MNYSEKLKDPRWQKLRLHIFERDEWKCRECGDEKSTLCIHHRLYRDGCEPWEYEDKDLVTLCENCHEVERDAHPEIEQFIITFLHPLLVRDLSRVYAALTEPGTVKYLCELGDKILKEPQ